MAKPKPPKKALSMYAAFIKQYFVSIKATMPAGTALPDVSKKVLLEYKAMTPEVAQVRSRSSRGATFGRVAHVFVVACASETQGGGAVRQGSSHH